MKLLYRGYKKESEFINDYISRIAKKNGYQNNKKFIQSINTYFDKVHGYTELNQKAKPRLFMETTFRRNIPLDEYHRYTQNKRYIWSKNPGECLECKDEHSYTRFYWWLSSYQNCHIHGGDMFAKAGGSDPDKHLDFPSIPNELCLAIVARYEKSAFIQKTVLDEIEKYYVDQTYVSSLIANFSEYGLSGDTIRQLREAVWSKGIIGYSVSERIQNIAKLFSGYMGSEAFWLRIMALSVRFYPSNALSVKGNNFEANHEYNQYFNYLKGTDSKLIEVFEQVREFKLRKEMDDISIAGIIDGIPSLSYGTVHKIRMAVFSLKSNNGWESDYLSSEDLFRKGDLNSLHMYNLNRWV